MADVEGDKVPNAHESRREYSKCVLRDVERQQRLHARDLVWECCEAVLAEVDGLEVGELGEDGEHAAGNPRELVLPQHKLPQPVQVPDRR